MWISSLDVNFLVTSKKWPRLYFSFWWCSPISSKHLLQFGLPLSRHCTRHQSTSIQSIQRDPIKSKKKFLVYVYIYIPFSIVVCDTCNDVTFKLEWWFTREIILSDIRSKMKAPQIFGSHPIYANRISSHPVYLNIIYLYVSVYFVSGGPDRRWVDQVSI